MPLFVLQSLASWFYQFQTNKKRSPDTVSLPCPVSVILEMFAVLAQFALSFAPRSPLNGKPGGAGGFG